MGGRGEEKRGGRRHVAVAILMQLTVDLNDRWRCNHSTFAAFFMASVRENGNGQGKGQEKGAWSTHG